MKSNRNGPKNISGERIQTERKRQSISRQKLAEMIQAQGVRTSYDTICKIETGKRVVWDYELMAFSRALHVSISFLLGEL